MTLVLDSAGISSFPNKYSVPGMLFRPKLTYPLKTHKYRHNKQYFLSQQPALREKRVFLREKRAFLRETEFGSKNSLDKPHKKHYN